MPTPQAELVAQILYAVPRFGEEPDDLGRTHWTLSWVEGVETLSQVWHGTLDELSETAKRGGFSGVEVQP